MADDLIRRSDVLNPYLEFSLPRGARHLVTDSLIAFFDYVKSVPSVDAVEVIRCQDCIWWDTKHPYGTLVTNAYHCERNRRFYSANHFCGYGGRKE